MRPLNAIDAIGPAWSHTRRILVAPRSWSLALKIGAVAVFAQLGGWNTGSFGKGNNHQALQHVPPALIAAIVAGAVLIAIAIFLIGLVLFYIGSRLQFVLFEVVLRNDTTVAPIWNRYGAATWRWIGLKVAFFFVALLCMVPFLLPLVLRFIRTMPSGSGQAPHDLFAFIAAIAGIGVTALILLFVAHALYSALESFGLPSMALESTSISETVERVFQLIIAEPAQVLLYLLMHLLMKFVGGICCALTVGIAALIAAIPLGGIGAVLWFTLHQGPMGLRIAMYAALAVLALLMLAVIILLAILTGGYLRTFLQAYALFFLGGRYPALGNYLEPFLPPPPPVYAAYPPYPGYPPPPAA